MSLKRRIYLSMVKMPCLQTVTKAGIVINQILFHWKERARMTHPGKEDPGTVYYVIRPRGPQEGLLSTYLFVGAGGGILCGKAWVCSVY